jgi:transposase
VPGEPLADDASPGLRAANAGLRAVVEAMREIVNAILYQGRTGCQRDYLPHDLPPRSAVSCYFARWRDDGTD